MLRVLFRHGLTVVPRLFVVCLITSVIAAGLSIATPILAGQVIGGIPALVEEGPTSTFVVVLVALLLVLLFSNLSGIVNDSAQRLMDGQIQKDASLRIGHALSVDPDLARLDDPTAMAEVAKIRARRWEVAMGVRLACGAMPTTVIGAVGSAVTLAIVLDWWVPIPLLAMFVVEAVRFSRVVTAQMDVWSGQAEAQKHAIYAFRQGMGGAAKEVRIFGLGDYLRRRYGDHMRAVYQPYWRTRRSQTAVNLLVNAARVAVTVGALAWAGWRASNGDLGLAALATSLPVILSLGTTDAWMFGQLQRASEEIGWMVGLTRDSDYPGPVALTPSTAPSVTTDPKAPSVSRVSTAARDRTDDGHDAVAPTDADHGPGPAGVVLDEVSFHYPRQESLVLDRLSLALPAGSATALVGVNGAGKSTLVKLLTGGYLPTGGQILVDGQDLSRLDPEERRAWQRRVAPITQDFIRLPLPAGDNVEFGTGRAWAGHLDVDPDRDSSTLDRVAERAGITDLIAGLPDGWATVLDKTIPGGTDLSGGEWQRIGLARALRAVEGGAGVLVLDEPAAALDVESEARLVRGYLDLARHVTSLVISHRFSVVRPVPRICVLADGGIVEDGSHEELMAMPDGRYRQMFTLQAQRYLGNDPKDADEEVRT